MIESREIRDSRRDVSVEANQNPLSSPAGATSLAGAERSTTTEPALNPLAFGTMKDTPASTSVEPVIKLSSAQRWAIETRERFDAYPQKPVAEVPHLAHSVPIIGGALNERRIEAGLEPKRYEPMLLDPERFDRDPYVQALRGEYGSESKRVEGFQEDLTGLTVIRYDDTRSQGSLSGQLKQIMDMGHELSHAGADNGGIGAYSFDLNEGFNEANNRKILEEKIFPQYLRPEHYASRDTLGDNPSFRVEGVPLTRDYVVMHDSHDGTGIVRSAYVPQLYVTDQMNAANPDAYHELQRTAVRGEPERAREIVGKAYGEDIAAAIAADKYDLKYIGDAIRERSKR